MVYVKGMAEQLVKDCATYGKVGGKMRIGNSLYISVKQTELSGGQAGVFVEGEGLNQTGNGSMILEGIWTS